MVPGLGISISQSILSPLGRWGYFKRSFSEGLRDGLEAGARLHNKRETSMERWTQSRPLIAEERRTPAYFDASFATAFVMRHVHVKFVRLYARVLSPALPKRSPIRAADYGSGTGVFASELCRCCTRAEIQLTLIDQSEVMLHAAKKLNSRRHLFPIQFKLGDFTADSQKYDLIIMARGSCKTARSPDFSKISGDF